MIEGSLKDLSGWPGPWQQAEDRQYRGLLLPYEGVSPPVLLPSGPYGDAAGPDVPIKTVTGPSLAPSSYTGHPGKPLSEEVDAACHRGQRWIKIGTKSKGKGQTKGWNHHPK